ncbi:MAG: tRNA guanosine(34) transglycosylase Tgt, partial [Patescibacteria group bacterium]|nr:tRNA guanosine(34) transglycosylase Tgt [Patescibacteria group bacterium]
KGDTIEFQSHLDGRRHLLTPQKVIDIQVALGSDIMMVLDECVGLPTSRQKALEALERTSRWAKLAVEYKKKLNKKSVKIKKQLIFGIVQGADFKDLRRQSVKDLKELDFDGYAIGGLAVGEPTKTLYQIAKYTADLLPVEKPRYLMGVGYPENILQAVKDGIDMFDCVIPTREARHGKLYLPKGKELIRNGRVSYQTINIINAKFAKDFRPINQTNLKNYSRAYLHHLFKSQEPLALRLATLNNLKFYLDLMSAIRQEIKKGAL